MGCRLLTQIENGEVQSVSGNNCVRGAFYAKQEAVTPERILTCLMRASNRDTPISVKTTKAVPKHLMYQCTEIIYATHPEAPVKSGQVLISDILGTGADVIATRDLP